ncbi:MAG: amidase domain-containing protein [Clostridia bacterium]|nr:amidase domain-containing protein [Clostridia bacterium]
MRVIKYNRNLAVEYAEKWAFKRNSNYYDFSFIGGDCTNFASQCLYQGAPYMNYTINMGWYYKNLSFRAPAWTGVEYFYNFLVSNFKGVGNKSGPFASEVGLKELEIGDFVQFRDANFDFYHTLIIVGFDNGIPLLASHSKDAYGLKLDRYNYAGLRCIKILGVRE